MTEFVASNGLRVFLDEYGGLVWAGGSQNGEPKQKITQAFREFFQAERDTALGRWRSKEFPEYAVYPKINGSIRVVEEFTGQSAPFRRNDEFTLMYGDIAAEYFAAHPESKPWHDAKPGEVWELTHDGNLGAWHVNGTGKEFFAPGALLDIDNEDITVGRRIWPES